ncbi:MAG: 2-oxo-4-hydroxy-4-carboxy-5-ureidoimidazoline decarboxylase [Actinomycetota bacterium]|nr:2-oxo-4-hydroxy-4-carboxy-5-ureidoimidazoline decarboxylase [Actinomycetota bacterium]
MHDLPRQLSVEELADLFGGRTRFVEALAARDDPIGSARNVLRDLPEDAQIEALNAHPPIGAPGLSGRSAAEQGADDDPETLGRLASLNQVYEDRFGFRFLVFVNRRPKAEIVPLLEERLTRARDEELETGLDELVAIAHDRWRRRVTGPSLPGGSRQRAGPAPRR